MKTLAKYAVWPTRATMGALGIGLVLAVLVLAAPQAQAREVYPGWKPQPPNHMDDPSPNESDWMSINQDTSILKPSDVLPYAGDTRHCLYPPFGVPHCMPADVLVQKYRSTTHLGVQFKRNYWRWSYSFFGGWEAIQTGPITPAELCARPDRDAYVKETEAGGYELLPTTGITYGINGDDDPGFDPWNDGAEREDYKSGDGDVVFNICALMLTPPNIDMCLSWYAGPKGEACSQLGSDENSKGVLALISNLSKELQQIAYRPDCSAAGESGMPYLLGSWGQVKPGGIKVSEFSGDSNQGEQCCVRFCALRVCPDHDEGHDGEVTVTATRSL